MKKYQRFLSENFQFLEVKFFIYLNRRVFVMYYKLIQFFNNRSASNLVSGTLIRTDLNQSSIIEQYSSRSHLCQLTLSFWEAGWGRGLGEAKVSCILRQRGVQLILAYSWARSAVLAAGTGKWGTFLFLLFLHFHSFFFLPCPSLSSPLSILASPFLWEMTQNDPQGLTYG